MCVIAGRSAVGCRGLYRRPADLANSVGSAPRFRKINSKLILIQEHSTFHIPELGGIGSHVGHSSAENFLVGIFYRLNPQSLKVNDRRPRRETSRAPPLE